MPLLTPELPGILEKNISQIVAMAGDGKLRDGSDCSKELCQFIQEIEAEQLFKYVDHCLKETFNDSGFVLQDIVNELGRRLGYEVENGRYRGTSNDTGQDGIWKTGNQTIIVEVKTTDAYRISLDTIVGYKTKLVESNTTDRNASILIVVGREDTGGLEAQIRGSRHAWEIRIISAKALCDLVRLKIKSEEPETTEKIQGILQPIEYTRLDALIDTMFTTVQDRTSDADETESDATDEHQTQARASGTTMEDSRKHSIRALGAREKAFLVSSTRSQFATNNKKIRAIALVSKVHKKGNLWFAFHPHQLDFLGQGEKGFLLLTSINQEFCRAIDVETFKTILPKLHTTTKGEKHYWHIHVNPQTNKLVIPLDENFDLAPYALDLSTENRQPK